MNAVLRTFASENTRGFFWSGLILFVLVAFDAPHVYGQAPSVAGGGAPGLRARARTVRELEEAWSKVTPEELLKAAEAGNPEAQYYYGVREWDEAREDNSRGSQWMMRAVANGKNLSESEKQASIAKWENASETALRKAAEAGERGALWFRGSKETGQASTRGRKGFEWMVRAAEQSLACAEFAVAVRYFGEIGWLIVPIDVKEGMKWLERSADHGFESALHRWADFYFGGRIVAPDIDKGVEYLRKAAELGCLRAQYELARHYASGEGQPASDDESPVELLKKSAEAGYGPALEALAERFRSGLGVSIDYIRAIRCYQSASAAEGEMSLGSRNRRPEILDLVDENFEPRSPLSIEYVKFAEVLGIYLKATERMNAPAMARLARFYIGGKVTRRSVVDAYGWFNLAAQRGYAAAAQERDELKQKMTSEELAEARRWEFRPTKVVSH
jgi:TPR repeat protein